MTQYAVVFDETPSGYSAWVPDLPGCVAAGSSLEEVQRLIREAIQLHIESLRAHGEPVPEPSTRVECVEARPPR